MMTRRSFKILSTSVICFLITSLGVPKAAADEIAGCLAVQNQSLYFIPQTDTAQPVAIPIKACINDETCFSASSLVKMNEGDCFQGSGEVVDGFLEVDHIEALQLNSLLGVWRNGTTTFNFKNLVALEILAESTRGSLLQQDFSYTVTPSAGEGWNLFISDRSKVYAAKLDFNRTALTVQLIDTSTGNTLGVVSLSR